MIDEKSRLKTVAGSELWILSLNIIEIKKQKFAFLLRAIHSVISLYIECDSRGVLRQLKSADQSGPYLQYRCTGPTACPHRLISCVQLAQNRLPYPPCNTLPYSMELSDQIES